jgi:hypothetical protein
MGERGEPGVSVRVFLADGTDLGVAHVPPPVLPGDLLALDDGLPYRVRAVSPTPSFSPFYGLVEVFPERRNLFRRGGDRWVPPRHSAP